MNKKTSAEWLEEYYPEPAGALVKRVGQDRVALVQHSLRKWRGLRPKVLKRYGLEVGHADIWAEDTLVLRVDTDTCALCWSFVHADCHGCPLVEMDGGERCGAARTGGFSIYCNTHDPEPMIALLLKALRREKRRKAAQRGTP